jgi:hypothetical protein
MLSLHGTGPHPATASRRAYVPARRDPVPGITAFVEAKAGRLVAGLRLADLAGPLAGWYLPYVAAQSLRG